MDTQTEFNNPPAMTKEMQDSVIDAFDALSDWGSEIDAVNGRCLGEVLDKTSSVARSLGWPEGAVKATRAYVEGVSKLQTQAIDQIVEGWKRQLKSPASPLGMPSMFAGQTSKTTPNSTPVFNPMAPWSFWMHAVQAWQRSWMPESSRGDRSRSRE
jgi:hypothetical protein